MGLTTEAKESTESGEVGNPLRTLQTLCVLCGSLSDLGAPDYTLQIGVTDAFTAIRWALLDYL